MLVTECDLHNSTFEVRDIPPIPTVLPIDPVTRRVYIPKPPEVSNEGTDEIKYFKLALMTPDEWAKSYSDDFVEFLEKNLNVILHDSIIQVVAAFFKVLWEKVELPAMPLSRIKVVISWPHCWGKKVPGPLNQLEQAVNLASKDIPELKSATYISEHEAACRSVLHEKGDDLNPLLQVCFNFSHAPPLWSSSEIVVGERSSLPPLASL